MQVAPWSMVFPTLLLQLCSAGARVSGGTTASYMQLVVDLPQTPCERAETTRRTDGRTRRPSRRLTHRTIDAMLSGPGHRGERPSEHQMMIFSVRDHTISV